VKFAICNEIFQGWKLEDTMKRVKEIGYDALEIAPFTLAPLVTEIPPEKRMEIRFQAETIGLSISGIHWVLAETKNFHLTHPEEKVRLLTARYFRELVDFCADIGGEFMVVGSPKQRSLEQGVTKDMAWLWAKTILGQAAKRAEERNVTICFEPLAPSETNFVNTAEDACRLLAQLNSPNFKIVLDVKAMGSESKSIPQIIKSSSKHLAYFHANDNNLKGPGFGKVDFVPIAAALKEVGYHGYVSVEVFNFDEGPDVIATKSLEYLKKVFV